MKFIPGCCNCGAFGRVCGVIKGCNLTPVAGVTVRLLTFSGTLVTSTTTDGSGAYCLEYAATGTYKVHAVAPTTPAGYVDTESFAASYGAGDHTANLTFTVASTHICVPCCNYPVKRTLSFDGVVSISYGGLSGGNHVWSGSHSYSGNTVWCDGAGVVVCDHPGTYSVAVKLYCSTTTNLWRVNVAYILYSCVSYLSSAAVGCDPTKYGPHDASSVNTCGYQIDVFFNASSTADLVCSSSPLLLDFIIPSTVNLQCDGTKAAPVAPELVGARSVSE